MKNSPLKISNITIQPGEGITLALPMPQIYTCAPLYIPIHIIHGKTEGPTLLICGSIHGDEINGVVITQRLLKLRLLKSLKGTLIVIPSINTYGMITLSRNLPDRRDLEKNFPGSEKGSFAARLAHLLTDEVFSRITHCIDLHTGEPHLSKYPQVLTATTNPEASQLAHYFQAPVIRNTSEQRGLLWLLHREEQKIPTIIYETGEALRLDESGIKTGVKGIVRVMHNLGMLKGLKKFKTRYPIHFETVEWIHAPSSGLCEIFVKGGNIVKKGERLARIFDPFGTQQKEEVFAPYHAMIIGKNNLPILNEGEPLLEIAEVEGSTLASIKQWSEDERSESE